MSSSGEDPPSMAAASPAPEDAEAPLEASSTRDVRQRTCPSCDEEGRAEEGAPQEEAAAEAPPPPAEEDPAPQGLLARAAQFATRLAQRRWSGVAEPAAAASGAESGGPSSEGSERPEEGTGEGEPAAEAAAAAVAVAGRRRSRRVGLRLGSRMVTMIVESVRVGSSGALEDDEDGDAEEVLFVLEEGADDGSNSNQTQRRLGGGGAQRTPRRPFRPAPDTSKIQDHPVAHTTRLWTAACEGSAVFAGRRRSEGGDAGGGVPGVNTVKMLHAREQNASGVGHFPKAEKCHIAGRFLPTDGPTVIDRMTSRAYIGQFSADGSMFIGGFQDKRIRLYDVDRGWALRKDVQARHLRWTITDTALSPDQRFLVYASITPRVHMVNVGPPGGAVRSVSNVTDIHEALDFAPDSRHSSFGLWSLQFSSDGRELVAGASDDCVYIYDVEVSKLAAQVKGHRDDVNAVAFADEASNVVFSGSDDSLCKVWDRRELRKQSPRAAGVLVGHLEGITHIDSKRDGRHFISNCKDQTIKLWDIRMMVNQQEYDRLPKARVPEYGWDYRWMDYPGRDKNVSHPNDMSVMTYRGHQVLQTLIRCYFSPVHTTGQKYIYTGSHDGAVYIFDLVTGLQVARMKHHDATVRDCSWHPWLPVLASTSWDGALAKWEFLRGEQPPPCFRPRLPDAGITLDDPDPSDTD